MSNACHTKLELELELETKTSKFHTKSFLLCSHLIISSSKKQRTVKVNFNFILTNETRLLYFVNLGNSYTLRNRAYF